MGKGTDTGLIQHTAFAGEVCTFPTSFQSLFAATVVILAPAVNVAATCLTAGTFLVLGAEATCKSAIGDIIHYNNFSVSFKYNPIS
ncbi:hypothetical protein SDC9_183292 [bioreactor metagenome]|uniref:Uncharacterized protein n=1 Tax=bioreactor metagenome TaxID=1076179 RepID=A0A645HAQ2_9ZZZZ